MQEQAKNAVSVVMKACGSKSDTRCALDAATGGTSPAGKEGLAPETQKAPELESSTGLAQKSLAATYFPT